MKVIPITEERNCTIQIIIAMKLHDVELKTTTIHVTVTFQLWNKAGFRI